MTVVAQRQELVQGLAGLPSATQMIDQAMEWLELLERWNRVFNLTAIPKPQRIAQLILTSIVAIPHMRGGRVMDVGSGAGVPGIPLAIFAPDNDYVLVDSNGKKTRFLKQCCAQLQLKRVQVVCKRVQAINDGKFDTIISRAFSRFGAFLSATRHLSGHHTRRLAFKHDEAAARAETEEVQIPCTIHSCRVPEMDNPVYLIQA